MSEVSENQSFSLDVDALDALRLEVQSVSPEKSQEFQAIVEEAYKIFLKKFGELFSQREIIPIDQMKDRFILVDKETMETFIDEWKNTRSNESSTYLAEEDIGTFRAYHSKGHFVVGIPIELWEAMNPQTKNSMIAQQGNEVQARKLLNQATWLNFCLHEITHLFQDNFDANIPLWLKELQAYWVARNLVAIDLRFNKPDFDARADFFQLLLNEYPDLHHVLLDLKRGKNIYTLQGIIKRVSKAKIYELFPNYRTN